MTTVVEYDGMILISAIFVVAILIANLVAASHNRKR